MSAPVGITATALSISVHVVRRELRRLFGPAGCTILLALGGLNHTGISEADSRLVGPRGATAAPAPGGNARIVALTRAIQEQGMDALTDSTSALDEAEAIGFCSVSFQSRFRADGLP